MNIYTSDSEYTDTPITASGSNLAIDIIKAGVNNQSWYITYFNWRVSGGSISNSADVTIAIKDGGTIIYSSIIAKSASNGSSLSMEFTRPIKLTSGNQLEISVGASGTNGTVITINAGLFQK